jgi:hypothetical protein
MCWLPARFPFLFLLQKGVLLGGDSQMFRVFTENYDLSGQARMRIMQTTAMCADPFLGQSEDVVMLSHQRR